MKVHLDNVNAGGQHTYHVPQDAKVLSFCNFQPNKVSNVLPHTGMAAQALKGAALVFAGSGWQRSEEECHQREMRFRHLLRPFDKSAV